MFAQVVIPHTKLDSLIYRVPDNLSDQIKIGSAVTVKLRKKEYVGIVAGLKNLTLLADNEIISLVDPEFSHPSFLRLLNWVAKYYFSSWGKTLALSIPKGLIGYSPKTSPSSVGACPQLNFLPRTQREAYPPLADYLGATNLPPVLNLDQFRAVRKILPFLRDKRFQVFLLYGITGSGKTEVYLRVLEEALRLKFGAIVLVPEISLTPLFVSRFAARFPQELVALHSSLSLARRREFYTRIKNGEFRVVIGPRSCIFAPVKNLGLIIVDEEHDPSYKEKDRSPHYNARDVAVMRAKLENLPVILGSATPSLESFYNAQNRQYELLSLPERIGSRPLPKSVIVDLRKNRMSQHRCFSPLLKKELKDRLKSDDQVIIFLNRRGFARFIQCADCGFSPTCPYCGIPLVYHLKKQLLCHFCKFEKAVFEFCPKCQGQDFIYEGAGTQRVEAEFLATIGRVPIIRMDRDTVKKRGAAQEFYESFGRGKAKVMIGTQIVTKGFDFPKVTLCAVISADTSLNLPDFRSSERTFQQLTQVIGRAGRGEKPGIAIIQTYHPDHYAIRYAVKSDYSNFYKNEMAIREKLSYPPFTRLALLRIYAQDKERAEIAGKGLRRRLSRKEGVTVIGPAPAFRAKKRDYFIYHLLLKIKKGVNFHQLYSPQDFSYPKVRTDLDIDPIEIL